MYTVTDGLQIAPCHAEQIETIRRRYDHETSSHAYNTLYIWRNFVGGQLHLEAELFSLYYRAKGPNAWIFPCGEKEAACRFIEAHLPETDFTLCYLREQDVQLLEERFPGCFRIEPAPSDSEYLVDRAEHVALAGKRYEKLRNKAKRAARDHAIEVQMLCEENLPMALDVIHAWRGNRTVQGVLDLYGDEEDAEPLHHLKELGLTGILMLVDGKPFGVAAGFQLSDDTYDLFLAKECTKDPALGYCLRREWMRAIPDTVRYVNLEDDLGIEGLRIMKKQMIPVKMNEMWMAVRA